MRRLALLMSVVVVLFLGPVSAQDRDKDKEEKTTQLHLLEKNAGANFGDWVVWRYDEGDKAVFLINQKTGLVIYLPWTSNGWINFRPKDGNWQVLYSKGEPKDQKRDDLMVADFVMKERPGVVLENGKYSFKDWTVNVTKDVIDFHCSSYDDRMTIRRASGEVVHNGRTLGEKK